MDAKDLEKKVQEKEEQIEEGKPKNKKSAIKYALNISLVLISRECVIKKLSNYGRPHLHLGSGWSLKLPNHLGQ